MHNVSVTDSHPQLNRLLGERIRLARRNYPGGMTQEILALKAKISRSSVANIERGRQGLTVAQLFGLAVALNVSPTTLLPTLIEYLQDDPLAGETKPAVRKFFRNLTSPKGEN